MTELRIIQRGHTHGWFLCELWRRGEMLAKASGPPCLLRQFAESLDNNVEVKSLISLEDSYLNEFLSRQGANG